MPHKQAEKKLPPKYVQLKKATGLAGAWHWVKQYTETRTTHWLITGCGKGMYATDSEVADVSSTFRARMLPICGRCDASSVAFYRKRGRKSKSRAARA